MKDKVRYMKSDDFEKDLKKANPLTCHNCDYKLFKVRLNKAIDVIYIECGICGAKAAIFKEGKK